MTERDSARGHHHHHHHDKSEDGGKGTSGKHSARKEKEHLEPKERRGSNAPPPAGVAFLATEARASDRASVGPAAGHGIRKSMAPTKASQLASDKDHGKAVLAAQSKHEETFLEREVKTDKHRALVTFPDGDVQVVDEQRPVRTMSKEESDPHGADPSIKATLEFFAKDWVRVVHKSEQFDGKDARLYRVENDMLTKEELPTMDEVALELLNPVTPDTRKQNLVRRRQNRSNLFRYYQVKNRKEYETPSDPRKAPAAFIPPDALVLQLDVQELSFQLGVIEPLFLSFTLYNITTGLRVAETFKVDFNDSGVSSLLPGHGNKDDTRVNTAIFTLPLNTVLDDIYVFVRLDRVLRGEEVDDALEPYFKNVGIKPKDKEVLLKEISLACSRLHSYHQPIAFAINPLTEEGQFISGGKYSMTNFVKYRSNLIDMELCQALAKERQKEREKGKKEERTGKFLPGNLRYDVKRIAVAESSALMNRINSALQPLKPFDKNAKRFVQEMDPFIAESDSSFPHMAYMNHLYVYPEFINMNKHKASTSDKRNVAIVVKLMGSDDDPNAPGVAAVYTDSKKTLGNSWTSSVAYHHEKATNIDELKLKLPLKLGSRHHLLFSFYHITCQTKGGKAEKNAGPVDTLLGYCVLPLYAVDTENGRPIPRIVTDGQVQLAMATQLVPHYLTPEGDSQCKWIDNKRPMFNVSLRVLSSVFTQDDRLNAFNHRYGLGYDSPELVTCTQELAQVKPQVLARHFPVLLNQLLDIIVNRNDQASKAAFVAFIDVVDAVNSLNPMGAKLSWRDPLLVSYLEYVLDTPVTATRLPFDEIVRHLLDCWRSLHPKLLLMVKYTWLLFDMVIKLMTLHLHKSGSLASSHSRAGRFSTDFTNRLQSLLTLILTEITSPKQLTLTNLPDVVRNVSLFVKDLLTLIDRPTALEFTYQLTDAIRANPDPLVQLLPRFEMLRILADHEHWVPLNLPAAVRVTDITSLTKEYWTKHPLVGLFLAEVTALLDGSDKLARSKSLAFLREIVWKQDLDPRYQDPEAKALITAMYFPFLLTTLERQELIVTLEPEEKRDWLVVFLFIVRNSPRRPLLREWWKQDTHRNRVAFLQLLEASLTVFEGFREPNMVKEASLTILDVLSEFLEDFKADITLPPEESDLLQPCFDLLMGLMRKEQSAAFLSSAFRSLAVFAHDLRKTLFGHKNPIFLGDILFDVLRYANANNGLIRSEAAALVYLLWRMNQEEAGHCNRSKLQSTIAVSKMAGEGSNETVDDKRDWGHIEKALTAVVKVANREFPKHDFSRQVDMLVTRLTQLMRDSMKIMEFRFDPEMTADLYYQVAVGYVDSPDLRVTWMENLSTYHIARENWAEAAQCKIAIAALIAEYLGRVANTPGVPREDDPAFVACCPNIHSLPPLPKLANAAIEEGLYQPKLFSEQAFVAQLRNAVLFLKRAELYEYCMELYDLLFYNSQYHRDYQKLGVGFYDLEKITNDLVLATAKQTRLFHNFYRVAFYGKALKELDGKEYVYKEKKTVMLPDICERLKTQFGRKYPKVTLLSNQPMDRNTLVDDGNTCFFQIITASEFLNEKEESERKTLFEKKNNVSQFIYESPFTMDGKTQSANMTEQYKRKMILSTDLCFPHVKKRLLVTAHREIVLSPIENATEIISDRAKATVIELTAEPVNVKTLQILLQGSVIPQVNAGPLAIARDFLGAADQFPAVHVERMRAAFARFLQVNSEALRRNKALIDPSQMEFQAQCEQGFAVIKKDIEAYLKGGRPGGVTLGNSMDMSSRSSGNPPLASTETPQTPSPELPRASMPISSSGSPTASPPPALPAHLAVQHSGSQGRLSASYAGAPPRSSSPGMPSSPTNSMARPSTPGASPTQPALSRPNVPMSSSTGSAHYSPMQPSGSSPMHSPHNPQQPHPPPAGMHLQHPVPHSGSQGSPGQSGALRGSGTGAPRRHQS